MFGLICSVEDKTIIQRLVFDDNLHSMRVVILPLSTLFYQVEYKPSSYTKDTLPLLHEFLSIVCSNFMPIPDTLNSIATPANSTFYQLSETILQYKKVFDECRRVNPNMAMT